MEIPTTLPTATEMAAREFTLQEWFTYYRNTWMRNAIARTVDVMIDERQKAVTPNEECFWFNEVGQPLLMTVSERLEKRKLALQDALDILNVVETLSAAGDNFESTYWTKEALAIAADMMPQPASEKQEEPAVEGVEPTEEKTDPAAPVDAEVVNTTA